MNTSWRQQPRTDSHWSRSTRTSASGRSCIDVHMLDPTGTCAQDQGPVCAAALRRYGTELEQGVIVTAEEQRVRIRPPDVTQR